MGMSAFRINSYGTSRRYPWYDQGRYVLYVTVPVGMGAFPFGVLDTAAGKGLFGSGGDCIPDLDAASPLKSFELHLVSVIYGKPIEVETYLFALLAFPTNHFLKPFAGLFV
jgi:hypothetical protein